jgi:hypothetical protein
MILPHDDPFAGVWNSDIPKSRFTTLPPLRPPLSWRQHIIASPIHLSVREEIAHCNSSPILVRVAAQFDGRDYTRSRLAGAETIGLYPQRF